MEKNLEFFYLLLRIKSPLKPINSLLLSVRRNFLHSVKRTTSLEPGDLEVVQSMVQQNSVDLAIFMFDFTFNRFSWRQTVQVLQANFVGGLDLVVVTRVGERKRQHTLLLQVGFVNTREGLDDDGSTAQVSGFQGGVLSGGTFSVVFVSNGDPLQAFGFVGTGYIRY